MTFVIRSIATPKTLLGAPRTLGAVLLAAASIIFFLSVLRVDTSRTRFYDMDPSPDSDEYFASAVTLKEEGTFAIQLGGAFYPPRYPPGYSALMVPFFYLPIPPVEVPFLVNRLLGAFLLLAGAFLLWRSGRPAEAGLFALLLASHPSFILLARSSMSELTSAALIFAGYWGMYLYLRRGSVVSGFLASLVLGLALSVKISNLFWLPILVVAPAAAPLPLGRRARHALIFVVSGLIAAAPLFAYNWHAFGSPLRTGYHLWVPYWADFTRAFGLKFVAPQLAYWWKITTLGELRTTVAAYFGFGYYWAPSFAVLCLLAAVMRARVRWFRVMLAGGFFYLAAMSCYFFEDARLLFSLIPLATVAIAVTLRELAGSRRPWLAGLALVLLVCQVLSFPGRRIRPELTNYLRASRIYGPATKYGLVQALESDRGRRPTLLLTDLNPPYVYALMKGRRVVSFLFAEHDYRFNPDQFSYGEGKRRAQMGNALRLGWEIYGVSSGQRDGEFAEWVAPPAGYRWVAVRRNQWNGQVARLVPE